MRDRVGISEDTFSRVLAPGFDRVPEIFEEVGSHSCCAYLDGSVVVDLGPSDITHEPIDGSRHAKALCAALLFDRGLVGRAVAELPPHEFDAVVRSVVGEPVASFFATNVARPLGLTGLSRTRALARMYAAAVGPIDGVRLMRPGALLDLPGFERSPFGLPTAFGFSSPGEAAFAIGGPRFAIAITSGDGAGSDATAAVVRTVLECLESPD